MKKTLFFISAVAIILSSCGSDACSIHYSGSDCSIQDTPTSILIKSITINSYPTSDGGGSWDTFPTSGPDIFLKILDDQGAELHETGYYTDLAGVNYSDIGLTLNPNQTIQIVGYDYDEFSGNDYMGGVMASIYSPVGGFPENKDMSYGDWSFTVELQYNW